MSVVAPWFKTSSEELERLIRTGHGPLWRRVADLAACRVQANGHAPFGRGMLARFFNEDRRSISRAIRTAISYGFLHESSVPECLVPPLWLVENSVGNGRKPCPVNHQKRTNNSCEERSLERGDQIDPGRSPSEGHWLPPTSSMNDDKPLHLLPPASKARTRIEAARSA